MALFGKKPAGPLSPDQIASLRQQGMSNDQIIQTLQNQGYESSQIFNVMTQADAGDMYNQPMQSPMGMPPEPNQDQQFNSPPEAQYAQSGGQQQEGGETIEEIAEAIIDEKWNDLLKDLNKISDWNNKTETRLTQLETEIKNLKESFDSLHRGILGKITEYDQNLVNVGTEIKAMEKVFQKILPTFTDNVNKLSRIIQDTKTTEPKKKLGI